MTDSIRPRGTPERQTPPPAPETLPGRLFFLHVPKCAGVSVCDALRAFALEQGQPEGAVFDLDVVSQTREARERGLDPWAHRDELLHAGLADPRRRLVLGHFRYDRDRVTGFRDRWTFATLLRDPREMLVSYYHFARFLWPDNPRYTQPLRDWVETGVGRVIAESYVQLLLRRERPYAPVTEKDTDAALRHLGEFQLVGVVENLPAFQRGLSLALGRDIELPVSNVSPAGAERHRRLDEALVARIDQLCAPSRRIYEEARARSGAA